MSNFYVASTTPLSPNSNGLASPLEVKLEYCEIEDLERLIATDDDNLYNYQRPILCYFDDNKPVAPVFELMQNHQPYWHEVGGDIYAFGLTPEEAFISLSQYLRQQDLLP